VLLTIGYLKEHGPIGLTSNKALKHYLVAWAAEVFDWAGYTVEDLYAVNKVLNEHDFPPLVILHGDSAPYLRAFTLAHCLFKSNGYCLNNGPAP